MPPIVHRLANKGEYLDCPNKEGLNLTYSGVFDFKYFYYILHEWIVENGFADDDKSFRENLLSQRDDSAGREIFIRWRFDKKTDYYSYNKVELDIHIHCLALGTTEIMVNNKKTKMDKGEIEVKILGRVFMHPDIQKHWFYKSAIGKKIITKKYLIEQRDTVWAGFYSDIYALQEAIKEYFELTRYSEKRDLLEYYKGRTGE